MKKKIKLHERGPEDHALAAGAQDWESQLRRLEEVVKKSEDHGLRARWESGRAMLAMREGKQLRRGMLAKLAKDLDVHRSELTARMKFNEKFPSEEELTNVISQFKTWFAIKQRALTTTHHEQKPRTSSLGRMLQLIENIDSATLDEADYELLVKIEAGIHRIKVATRTLKEVA